MLVFAGLDPSGGAGISADIEAIAAQGAHALPIVTALTVQDNNHVYDVQPVDSDLLARQVQALVRVIGVDAVKIGIPGNRENAEMIAALIIMLRAVAPGLPVVLDPILASGHGGMLTRGDALDALEPLLGLSTLLVPNLPEASALGRRMDDCANVLVTGGHRFGDSVVNTWSCKAGTRSWQWPRLPDTYHGSGCTLGAAIAAHLALGESMEIALYRAQAYCHEALEHAFSIASGQRIPRRSTPLH